MASRKTSVEINEELLAGAQRILEISTVRGRDQPHEFFGTSLKKTDGAATSMK